MESKDACVLGKNPQSNVSDYGYANDNLVSTRKSNDLGSRTPYSDFGIEVRTYDFGYSNPIVETDNRQTNGATAPKLDTTQNQAKSNY